MRHDKMHLVAYLKTGATSNHPGGWRHPQTDLDDVFRPERYARIGKILEAACFDSCFFADTLGIPDVYQGSFRTYVEHGGQLSYLDPMMVLPIIASATNRIGLGATLSTTFHQPFHLARWLASLDHLSGGRACWNIVTSTMDFEARNFGMDGVPSPQERYDRGDEVVEACCALWDCWAPDALILDKDGGLFADPDKVKYAAYKGRYVSTMGPPTVPHSPQGRPVLMQAGSSDRGRDFAARWAEVIFCSMATIADAKKFYGDVKSRMDARGRGANECRILPAISTVLGETDAIAVERAEYLNSLSHPDLTLAYASAMLGADVSRVGSAEELEAARGHQGHGGLVDKVRQTMKSSKISFQEATRKRKKGAIVGSPTTVADTLEEMFAAEACDGFVLQGNITPGMFEDFGRMVVPELQRRGLFRTEYAHATLRENLRH